MKSTTSRSRLVTCAVTPLFLHNKVIGSQIDVMMSSFVINFFSHICSLAASLATVYSTLLSGLQ